MSSKRKKEEEYNSDEDEDFVPDAGDLEGEEEVFMDENEEEITQKKSVTKRKTKTQKDALPPRPKQARKGPFDSDDEDEEEVEPEQTEEEEEEPPAKRSKLEENGEREKNREVEQAESDASSFFASMMKGRTPTVEPITGTAASHSTTKPSSTLSTSTTEVQEEPSEAMSFFAMMKAGIGVPSTAKRTSAPAEESSKLGIPSHWLQSSSSEAPTAAAADERPATLSSEPEKLVFKEQFEFAGEKVEVVRMINQDEAAELRAKKSASGLDGLLGQLKGKNKISTLQKTKIDWNKFTEDEGLEDEFTKNRKDGYIQKKEFLQNAEAAETAAYIAGRARARK